MSKSNSRSILFPGNGVSVDLSLQEGEKLVEDNLAVLCLHESHCRVLSEWRDARVAGPKCHQMQKADESSQVVDTLFHRPLSMDHIDTEYVVLTQYDCTLNAPSQPTSPFVSFCVKVVERMAGIRRRSRNSLQR